MWKIFLTFGVHRLLLFLVALLAVHQSLSLFIVGPGGRQIPRKHSFSLLVNDMKRHVREGREVSELTKLCELPAKDVFKSTSNAFMWVSRWVVATTGLSPLAALVIISNVFFLIFIGELNSLLNRMVTRDMAFSSTVLVLLWPTTYELNLGSTFAMTCCLVTLTIRQALDNRWLIGGIALGVLALMEPLSLGLLPLVFYIFWYFQRHFPLGQVVKRACFFLVPMGIAVSLRHGTYSNFLHLVSSSAFFNLYSSAMAGKAMWWTFSQSLAGQTITVIFFLTGAIAACISNTTMIHRVIPAYMAILLLLFSSYGSIASRAPLAGICLEGIALVSARSVLRIIYFTLIALGTYEVYSVFV